MGPIALINLFLNFMAPAVAVGVLLAVMAAFFARKVPLAPAIPAQAAINSVAGGVALLVGLWFFGRDGKMASYAAMVLACASAQWLTPWLRK